MARRPLHPATVVAFDEAAGWGTLEVDGVGERTFHCTAIAGDARTIEVATPVLVALAPGPTGTVEAVAVQPTGG